MGILSSVINGVSNLGSSIVGAYAAKKQQEREFEQQKVLQQNANDFTENMWQKSADWNLEQWNRENEYNAPSAQLQRMVDAGINPNAAVQQMTGGEASSVTTSGAQGANGSVTSAANTIGNLIGNSVNNFWQNELVKQQAKAQEINNGTLKEMNEAAIKQTYANIDKLEADKEFTKEQANQIRELLPGLKGKTDAEIREIEQMTAKLQQETDLTKAKIKTEEKTQGLLEAQTSETKQTEALKLQQELELKWKNLFREQYGVNPDAPGIAALIQSLITGHGDKVITGLFSSIKGVISESESGVGGFFGALSEDAKTNPIVQVPLQYIKRGFSKVGEGLTDFGNIKSFKDLKDYSEKYYKRK